MAKKNRREILVTADWQSLGEAKEMGWLSVVPSRGGPTSASQNFPESFELGNTVTSWFLSFT